MNELLPVGKCWYCECDIFENGDFDSPVRAVMEHKIPRSRGGKWLPHNTVPSCNACNIYKATLTTQEMLVGLFLGYCEEVHRREVIRAVVRQKEFSTKVVKAVVAPIF